MEKFAGSILAIDLEVYKFYMLDQDFILKIGWLLFTTLPLPCHERGITLTAYASPEVD